LTYPFPTAGENVSMVFHSIDRERGNKLCTTFKPINPQILHSISFPQLGSSGTGCIYYTVEIIYLLPRPDILSSFTLWPLHFLLFGQLAWAKANYFPLWRRKNNK